MTESVKSVLAVVVVVCVFGLCALGVYKDSMSVEAALATSLAALTSSGALAALFAKKEDEEK